MDQKIIFILGLCVLAEGKVVDLTHFQNDNDTMIWPFYTKFKMTVLYRDWFGLPGGDKVWVEYNDISTPEHLGTHMDAPVHLANSNAYWKLHEIPVDRFLGDAVVIDITERAKNDPDTTLLVSDLEQWEERNGQIQDGSIVLMYSGWDQYWGNRTAYFGNDQEDTQNFHFPGFSVEASKWLVKNRVISGVGGDTISFDTGSNVVFEAHRIILSENIYGLENVMNLGRLPEAGARVYVFPMKIKDGSGSPCRIIAEFDHLDPTEVALLSKASSILAASLIKQLLIYLFFSTIFVTI